MNVDTMFKDSQTQRYAQRRTHRTYTSQFKADLVALTHHSHESVAALALQHGINANLLHRWRKECAQGLHRSNGDASLDPHTPKVPEFIPIAMTNPKALTTTTPTQVATPASEADIRIECRCRGMTVTVNWPTGAAEHCVNLLRELLR